MTRPYFRAVPRTTPLLFLLPVAALICSCEDALYAAFVIPGKTREFRETRGNVELRLRLTSESLLNDKLYIINKSSDTVYMNPREFYYAVNGRNFRIPVEEDFDAYLMKMNSKASQLCNSANFPYKCVDGLTNMNNRFRGKGFTFNALYPGRERKGFFAFGLPTPLYDSPVKDTLMIEWGKNYKTLRGAITIELIVGSRVETITFPMEIELYTTTKKAPAEIRTMLR